MGRAKRVFVISDFKEESAKAIQMQPRMWLKGLTRLGHDVYPFAYRNIMMQCSPLPGKNIARKFAKAKADQILVDLIQQYCPDIVLVLGMKYVDGDTIGAAREVARNAVFVSRDDDPYPEKDPGRVAIASHTDLMVATNAGRFLEVYEKAGVPVCAFLPNMCDPDIQYRYDVGPEWKCDVVFTGKTEHKRLERDDRRYYLIQRLSEMGGARIYGACNVNRVEGIDYFRAISGARLGLSINIANDVRFYHSDRLTNYLSCGTCVLAKRVPDTELLFQNEVHLHYFDDVEEFFELADWYRSHERERARIADAGMARVHGEFNAQKIAGYLLDLVETGAYSAPWTA
jgi:hypothetical protein